MKNTKQTQGTRIDDPKGKRILDDKCIFMATSSTVFKITLILVADDPPTHQYFLLSSLHLHLHTAHAHAHHYTPNSIKQYQGMQQHGSSLHPSTPTLPHIEDTPSPPPATPSSPPHHTPTSHSPPASQSPHPHPEKNPSL